MWQRDDRRARVPARVRARLEVGQQALLSFGIRAQSLADQQALIDRVRGEIGDPGSPGGPPAGVEVHLAGLPVIAAESAALCQKVGWNFWYCRRWPSTMATTASRSDAVARRMSMIAYDALRRSGT